MDLFLKTTVLQYGTAFMMLVRHFWFFLPFFSIQPLNGLESQLKRHKTTISLHCITHLSVHHQSFRNWVFESSSMKPIDPNLDINLMWAHLVSPNPDPNEKWSKYWTQGWFSQLGPFRYSGMGNCFHP